MRLHLLCTLAGLLLAAPAALAQGPYYPAPYPPPAYYGPPPASVVVSAPFTGVVVSPGFVSVRAPFTRVFVPAGPRVVPPRRAWRRWARAGYPVPAPYYYR
jgi:hypothetical protein